MQIFILPMEFWTSVGSDLEISLAWVKAKESPVIGLNTPPWRRATSSAQDGSLPSYRRMPSTTAAKLLRKRLRPLGVIGQLECDRAWTKAALFALRTKRADQACVHAAQCASIKCTLRILRPDPARMSVHRESQWL